MLKFFIIRAVFITCAFIYHAQAVTLLETCQLPLSNKTSKTFPKIKSVNFIISVPRLGIVLHEGSSKELVRCGNFSIVIENIASISQETLNPDIDKYLEQYGHAIPKHTDIRVTDYGIAVSPYTMCNLFAHEYFYISKNHKDKKATERINILLFKSAKNIGCICRYKNINNVVFDIIVYGNNKRSDVIKDIELIIHWLDRFVIKEVQVTLRKPIYIPVFYGEQDFIRMTLPQIHELLVEKGKTEQIIRTIRYLARISAPVAPNDSIGYVFYKYSIFQNPIKFNVYSNTFVKKSNAFKNLADSTCYIIYNRPYMR